MLLVDTDILIDIQRGYLPAVEWFSLLSAPPSVPGFVVMELIQDAQDSRQVQQAQKVVAPLPVIWPSQEDCYRALTDFSNLHLSHSLGLLDALIAATAIGHNAILVTFNLKHYRCISGLRTEQPYSK